MKNWILMFTVLLGGVAGFGLGFDYQRRQVFGGGLVFTENVEGQEKELVKFVNGKFVEGKTVIEEKRATELMGLWVQRHCQKLYEQAKAGVKPTGPDPKVESK